MIEYTIEVTVSKNTRAIKEYTREQRLVNENKTLKQEIKSLRKILAKLDVDRLETVKEMCNDYEESQRFEENLGPTTSGLEALKKEWGCKKCGNGFLEITLYSKLNQTFYYRKCNSCDNRTKGQRYDEKSVRGIFVNSQKKVDF